MTNSPQAYSVNTVICSKHHHVHFIVSPTSVTTNNISHHGIHKELHSLDVSGVAEFMTPQTLRLHHKEVYLAGRPHGNVSSVVWDNLLQSSKFAHHIKRVTCMPLHTILHWSGITHINWFVLDVEVYMLSFFIILLR